MIRTKSGTEIRVPIDELLEIVEVEPSTGDARPVAPHPYLHREGVNRCGACWRDRLDPVHGDG